MKRLLFYALIPFIGLTACKKEGCTNPDAINYNEKAKKDDFTCQYEGKYVFWYDEQTSQDLIDYDSQTLTFYVDGAVVGSTATNVFWTGSPDCGDDASITVTKDLGSNTTQSYNYRVIDNYDEVIWEGVANFNANTCTGIQLVF